MVTGVSGPRLKWWEWPFAIGTGLIVVGFHAWKWVDDRLKKEGV